MNLSLSKTKNLPSKHPRSKRNTLNTLEKNLSKKNLSKNSSSKNNYFEDHSLEEDSLEEDTSSEITLEEQNTSKKKSSMRERSKKSNLENKTSKRFLMNSKDSTTSRNLLDQPTLFSAIPREPYKLDKNRKKILRLIDKESNWEHRYQGLNPLEYAVMYSDLSVIMYLLRFNPPRSIMHEALIRAFWYHGTSFEPLLTKDKSLMDDIPRDHYKKITDGLIQTVELRSFYKIGKAMASALKRHEETNAKLQELEVLRGTGRIGVGFALEESNSSEFSK